MFLQYLFSKRKKFQNNFAHFLTFVMNATIYKNALQKYEVIYHSSSQTGIAPDLKQSETEFKTDKEYVISMHYYYRNQ